MDIDWTAQVVDQLEFQWSGMLRPRLDALTDDAYLWEPVPANHFGGPVEVSYEATDWPLTAAGGLALLDHHHDAWLDGVRALDADGLARPCGPAEGPYADAPFAALVLHINREAVHHGAEIALLLDLYAHRHDGDD